MCQVGDDSGTDDDHLLPGRSHRPHSRSHVLASGLLPPGDDDDGDGLGLETENGGDSQKDSRRLALTRMALAWRAAIMASSSSGAPPPPAAPGISPVPSPIRSRLWGAHLTTPHRPHLGCPDSNTTGQE